MTTPPPITIALARFEDLLARGLREVIDSEPSLEIVARDVACERIDVTLRAHRPRVAILDVDALPHLATVRELSRHHPDTRLVLIASHPTPAECAQLLAFGASACLGRDTQARDVLTAIHLASRGLQLVPRGAWGSATTPAQASHLLTAREAEVLPLLQQGSSNAQIAAALGVGVETVRSHARNIYRKLGVSSRRELAALPRSAPVEPEGEGPSPSSAHPAARRRPESARAGPGRRRSGRR
jgi:DNA-binding NarL/FixJ family response regulator